jgi:hypothetical protein
LLPRAVTTGTTRPRFQVIAERGPVVLSGVEGEGVARMGYERAFDAPKKPSTPTYAVRT